MEIKPSTLISHYELGNDFFLSYQIKSVFRSLHKMDDLQAVQKEMLGFLRKTPLMTRKDLKGGFVKLRARPSFI